jgi:hypothetical protein
MSDETTLSRFSTRVLSERSEIEPLREGETWDDLGCFGWLRGNYRERSTMLELRKRDGSILAIGYGWLERIEFDPSMGITLHMGGQHIRIVGRNLNAELRPCVRLFEGLTRHRIPWLRETPRDEHFHVIDSTCAIDSIDW